MTETGHHGDVETGEFGSKHVAKAATKLAGVVEMQRDEMEARGCALGAQDARSRGTDEAKCGGGNAR
jgi:hypothetical protein